jgi:hypothetical protein
VDHLRAAPPGVAHTIDPNRLYRPHSGVAGRFLRAWTGKDHHTMPKRHGKPRRRRYQAAWGCPISVDYTRLPEAAREHLRGTARTTAQRAARPYADLLAEAGIAARAAYPTARRLVFRLSTDVFGASATLVAAYTADGRQLWHLDTSDEWPDESLVTDFLAAAAEMLDDYFPPVDAAAITEAGDELYAYDLRRPTSRA